MRKRTPLSLAGFSLAVLAGLALASGPDIVGTWLGKTEIPDAGLDELTMVITKTESGYAGLSSDTLGYLAPNSEMREIKLDKAELTFSLPLVDGQIVFLRMTVDGDKMAGTWTTSEGNMGAIAFEKKK
ncbi:MAG: hypothetical protein FJY82_01495 [Candidatus Aminicenantes bacterium]|nr:hypothetical protein [Candidatus Aminicenantes bacterium]